MTAPPALVRRSPVRATFLALGVVCLEATLLAFGAGGWDALARHPRALALLAVWTTTGVALAVRRPVRAQDIAERPPGQAFLLVVLLVVPLFTPMACAWLERGGIAPLPGGAALRWTGVALAAAGLAVRVAAMARLGDRFAPLVAIQREHTLETRGLYGVVRHPGYAGAALANLGSVLAFGSAWGLVSAALFVAALEARMRAEESLLERRFGAEWSAYAARTGRWLPRAG